jgi:hypothetical protein
MSQQLTCQCTCDALQVAASQPVDAGTQMLGIGVAVLVFVVIIVAGIIMYKILSKKIDDDDDMGGQTYY